MERVLHLAAEYLSTKIYSIPESNPYQMAITTYALHRAPHRTKAEAYERFKLMARKSEFLYWSDVEIPKNPTQIVNTRILMGVRDKHETQGQALRATCYGLMLYLEYDEFEEAKPIVSWIRTQPNALVGWDSSQDTLLVFQVKLGRFQYSNI